MKKKIVISHAFGPDNRGDHELLEKLINILRKKYGGNISLTVFSSFPDKSKEVFNDDNIIFEKSPISFSGKRKTVRNLWSEGLKFIGYLLYYNFKLKFLLNPECQRKVAIIEEAEFIYYCPGGYLYSNGLSYYVNIINGLILNVGRAPIILSPMSIGPFYNKIDYKLGKILLNTIDYIFVRESYSENLVKKMGFHDNIQLTTDLAWYNSNIEIYDEDLTWRDSYVITVIDWDFNDVGNQIYNQRRYFSEIIKCCESLYKLSGNKVILYNQVGSGKGMSKDEQLIRDIVNAIPGIVLFEEEELTPYILKSRLHNCKGLIASRFHSALFAIQAKSPFIALSYQPKAEFILKDVGLSKYSRKIHQFSGEEVAAELVNIGKDDGFVDRIQRVILESQQLIDRKFFEVLPD